MRITGSNVMMTASSVKNESYTSMQAATYRVQNNNALGTKLTATGEEAEDDEKLDLSEEYLTAADRARSSNKTGTISADDPLDMKIKLMQRMIESLTGKRTEFRSFAEILLGIKDYRPDMELNLGGTPSTGGSLQTTLSYESYERYEESEKMTFSSVGQVTTADGQTIAFSVNMSMSRELVQESYQSYSMNTQLCDPLIVNYSGSSAELTQTRFDFDLNADGTMDSISFAKGGSGFLALDKNGDGKINNGSELFGTQSGDGFSDLAQYDSDKNGWIDENDDVFTKLSLWSKDETGKSKLVALGAAGVGAIYLGSVDSQFSIKSSIQDMQGLVRRTGVFLKETGGAGTIQHVDLTI